MTCLPDADEWSPQTQWLLVQEHIYALQAHIESITQQVSQGAQKAVHARADLQELSQRTLEAHELLTQLSGQPPDVLARLEETP